jgi:hypothetical protein
MATQRIIDERNKQMEKVLNRLVNEEINVWAAIGHINKIFGE